MRLHEILNEMMLREAKPSKSDQKGTLDLKSNSYKAIKSFIKDMFEKYGKEGEFAPYVKTLQKYYEMSQVLAASGHEKRKDMPVVNSNQVNLLQTRLEQGRLDVISGDSHTFHKGFPNGLTDEQAEEWLEKGLHDGDEGDDIVRVTVTTRKAVELTPIQKEIYVDKSIEMTFRKGLENTKTFLKYKSYIIVSSDGYILDGHHRWLAAMLLDPQMAIQIMVIDMPKNRLIDLLTAYGDAIGNERNK